MYLCSMKFTAMKPLSIKIAMVLLGILAAIIALTTSGQM